MGSVELGHKYHMQPDRPSELLWYERWVEIEKHNCNYTDHILRFSPHEPTDAIFKSWKFRKNKESKLEFLKIFLNMNFQVYFCRYPNATNFTAKNDTGMLLKPMLFDHILPRCRKWTLITVKLFLSVHFYRAFGLMEKSLIIVAGFSALTTKR